jgi:hypothetical protein
MATCVGNPVLTPQLVSVALLLRNRQDGGRRVVCHRVRVRGMVTIAILCGILWTGVAAGSVERLPVFGGCTSKVRVRPGTITFACADGNFYATSLRWTRWAPSSAAATGIGRQNDCTPNCAAGRFHTYALAVTLSMPRVCAGFDEFAKTAWRFTKTKPNGAPRTGSESFSCHWRTIRP